MQGGDPLAEDQRQQSVDLPGETRRAEIAVTMFGLVLPTLVTLVYFVGLASAPELTQQIAFGSCKTFQFLLPVIWVCLIRRERIGLPENPLHGVIGGIGFGLVISLAMVALYSLWLKPSGLMDGPAVLVRDKVQGIGVDGVGKYFVMGVFYSLIHSFFEEYYWRWFIFGRLQRWTSLNTAVIVSSLGFMAHHVLVIAAFFGWTNPLTYFFSISVAVGGAVWAILYWRNRNLVAPWLSHLIVDAAIFLIGFLMVRNQLA